MKIPPPHRWPLLSTALVALAAVCASGHERAVALYLTLGLMWVLFLLMAGAQAGLLEPVADRYRQLGGKERARFWIDEALRPAVFWPLSAALSVFAAFSHRHGAKLRDALMTNFRREYLDSDRVRRALEPQPLHAPVEFLGVVREVPPAGALCCYPSTPEAFGQFYAGQDYAMCLREAVVRERATFRNATDSVHDLCANHVSFEAKLEGDVMTESAPEQLSDPVSKDWTAAERLRVLSAILPMIQNDIYAGRYSAVGRPNITTCQHLLNDTAEELEPYRAEIESMLAQAFGAPESKRGPVGT